MYYYTNDGLWSDLSHTGRSQLAVTALTENACQIRTPLFVSLFAARWKNISKIRDMGFVHNKLIYLNQEEIAKKSHGLRYTGGSSRGYFPYLLLRPVPKLLAVTVMFQLLQITSWGLKSSFP